MDYAPVNQTNIKKFSDNTYDTNKKIAAAYSIDGKTMVLVVTNASILEIDWTDDPQVTKSYDIPDNIDRFADLQFNSRMIML